MVYLYSLPCQLGHLTAGGIQDGCSQSWHPDPRDGQVPGQACGLGESALSTLAFPPHGLPWHPLIMVARFQECLKRQEVGAASSGGLGPEVGTAPLLPYSFVKESQGRAQVEWKRLPHLCKRSQRIGGL